MGTASWGARPSAARHARTSRPPATLKPLHRCKRHREAQALLDLSNPPSQSTASLQPSLRPPRSWAPGNYLSKDGGYPLATEEMQRAVLAR
jgi:hypothetical protein